ncbi:hypothetical protein [Tumebacillus lipolyticus]|uniref:Uncharacterized protein n=1 Tax=Tumebacillus lipolyticus TaxID=1280370 RepID=A0ABW4ZY15_9BACL
MGRKKVWVLVLIFIGILFSLFINFGQEWVEKAPLIGWSGAAVCYLIALLIARSGRRRR